ncbi:uncharacterized protein LOC101460451 [Ceratitis capitata]|uniref:uncharacterized protein LOC101460451 n=1 Tax=Ceratitis capitata TaxID=7213 RepID=UPI000329E371|nr:uncharacterized protein LOC101460451 [Ceratitis capitata]
MPTITERQPATTLSISQWNITGNIKLADPSFNTSRRIDILIGASMVFDLLCVGQLRLKEPMHILQKTLLGWTVSGGKQGSVMSSSYAVTSKIVDNRPSEALDQMVRSFWETENCFDETMKITKEELDCEMHFQANYHRLSSGEYSVRLPVKQDINFLGDSYQHALRRLFSLERRLQRNAYVRLQYETFMREYVELKHMSLVVHPPNVPKYYLPLHCVFKEDSTTTKLRVVFDGLFQAIRAMLMT